MDNTKKLSFQLLMLITTPKLAEEAAEILMRKGLPVYFPYQDEFGKIHDWYHNGEGVIERP